MAEDLPWSTILLISKAFFNSSERDFLKTDPGGDRAYLKSPHLAKE